MAAIDSASFTLNAKGALGNLVLKNRWSRASSFKYCVLIMSRCSGLAVRRLSLGGS